MAKQEKWAFHFTRYTDGEIDLIFLGRVSNIKHIISNSGYPIMTAKVDSIEFVMGTENDFLFSQGIRLIYPWQVVDSLIEAQHLLIAGILYGISFGSIENDMSKRPF